ncbi:Fe-S cluster assembly protein NifU [Telmatospirillum siberiense]|uniref:Nitrogen fixation protein NifU n=1 Tax=Telmatospirillum siberiense TaxID=382514 RepID=A0A2N3PVZ8_9PROT|nr:Fe-S cluster assembly protein NifU [Telmatospirillum siberiense]PKU24555.1 Fe-S cluster assembly protein NifU [Telmatospirillum siberiense]
MWEYSDKVKEYFFSPKNAGPLTDATAVGEVGAMSCGDALRLMLKIDPASEVITDARFQTFGCGSAIASSSALTELIIGKTLAEAMTITNQDIADFLGGLPPEKMHCSVMGYEALRAAVANYRGETWEDDHEEGALICKCFGIDEGIIDRAIRMNRLTSIEQVAHYTKVTGSCGTCAEKVEDVLARVNRAMVEEGLLAESEAFDPAAAARMAPRPKAVQPAAPGKLTTLQRLRLIEEAIEELRPVLKRDGGDCELIDIEDDLVTVKLTGACTGCQLASVTIDGIQQRLIEKLGRPLRVVPVPAGH